MNVMSCPRCGRSVPAGSAFCPTCGQALAPAPRVDPQSVAASGVASLQNDFDAQRRRAMVIGGIVALIALVAALVFGMRAFNGLSAHGGTPQDPLLTKNAQAPKPILQANANQGPPVLNRDDRRPEQVKMPQDVFDWLKHLERCEAMKVSISGDQAAEVSVWMQKFGVLGAGMGLMDPYDQSSEREGDEEPSGYAKGKINNLRPRWEELIAFFRSVPPPAECRPIANDFDRAISEIPGMMGDLGDILNSAAEDPQSALQKVKKIQNSSYGDIDIYFGRCDQKVSQICNKYNTHKWFNIKTDVLAGGMMGKFGGIGGGAGGF